MLDEVQHRIMEREGFGELGKETFGSRSGE